MFDIGLGELVFIFVVFLLLFGPKSLPDLARKIAYGMNKIKQAQAEFQSQFNSIQHDIQSAIDIDKKKAGISIDTPVKSSPQASTFPDITPKPLEEKTIRTKNGKEESDSKEKSEHTSTSSPKEDNTKE
jgi:TatA/E family protein of Tat protein translocase